MSSRDDFRVIDGGRADSDPSSQDEKDALAALTELLAGPEGEQRPERSARAAEIAAQILRPPAQPRPPAPQD